MQLYSVVEQIFQSKCSTTDEFSKKKTDTRFNMLLSLHHCAVLWKMSKE